MAVAGEAAHPSERDMLRVADACDLSPRRARDIIQEVRSAVRHWPVFARATGVSAATMRRIEEMTRRHGGTAMK
jgi:hypothetical protein